MTTYVPWKRVITASMRLGKDYSKKSHCAVQQGEFRGHFSRN
jgi:hypothetical protein